MTSAASSCADCSCPVKTYVKWGCTAVAAGGIIAIVLVVLSYLNISYLHSALSGSLSGAITVGVVSGVTFVVGVAALILHALRFFKSKKYCSYDEIFRNARNGKTIPTSIEVNRGDIFYFECSQSGYLIAEGHLPEDNGETVDMATKGKDAISKMKVRYTYGTQHVNSKGLNVHQTRSLPDSITIDRSSSSERLKYYALDTRHPLLKGTQYTIYPPEHFTEEGRNEVSYGYLYLTIRG